MFMKKWFLHKNSNLKDEFKDDIINKFDTEQQMKIFTENECIFSKERIHLSTDLLKSIILNRVSALVGRASSGKTYLLEDLLKRSGLLKQSITVYLTPETDVNQLCGSYVLDNSKSKENNASFRVGPLLDAITTGKLFIIEKAEYMNDELLESIEQFVDPLTHTISYLGQNYSIHPNFRLLYVFRSYREYFIHQKLPSYVKQIHLELYSKDDIREILDNDLLFQLYNEEEMHLNILIVYKHIFEKYLRYSRNKVLDTARIVILFQPESKLLDGSPFINKLIDFCCELMKDNNKEKVKETLFAFKEKEIDIEEGYLKKDDIEFFVGTKCNMDDVSDYFKQCLFRLELLKGLDKVPPILIGGSESKDEFIQLFYKNSHNIELSRAMEIDHLIGYSSIINKEEANKLLFSVGGEVNNDWTKDIQSFTSNKNTVSSMIFHPGQIVLSIFRNEPVILQNLELLNENVIPRVDALLESYRNNKPYYIQESDKGYNVSLENCSFVALIDENAYSRTPLLDSFINLHFDDC